MFECLPWKIAFFKTMKTTALDFALSILFFFAVLCIALAQLTDGHNFMGGDFAQYIAEGIALANGTLEEQIAANTWMMQNSYRPLAPYHYPWGMALLLAPLVAFFGVNFVAFKFVGIICYALFAAVFYHFCAKELPRIAALVAAILFVFNPFLTFYASWHVLSDLPFLFFAFSSILMISQFFDLKNPPKNLYCYAIFCGAFVAFASLIRSNGIVILFTLFAVHIFLIIRFFINKIFSKNFKEKRFFKILNFLFADFKHLKIAGNIFQHLLIYIVFLIIYFSVDFLLPKSEGSVHLHRLADELTLGTLLHHLDYYILKATLFLGTENSGILMLFLLCTPLFGAGIAKKVAENPKHIFLVLALFSQFLLVVFWPPIDGFRFVIILLPFLVFYTAAGIVLFCKQKRKYGAFVLIPIVFLALNFLGVTYVNLKIYWPVPNNETAHSITSKTARELWHFIQQNTPQNAIILSYNPRTVYLTTRRLGFASTNTYDIRHADFVLTTHLDNIDMMRSDTAEFHNQTKKIFGNENFQLYQVLKPENPR